MENVLFNRQFEKKKISRRHHKKKNLRLYEVVFWVIQKKAYSSAIDTGTEASRSKYYT